MSDDKINRITHERAHPRTKERDFSCWSGEKGIVLNLIVTNIVTMVWSSLIQSYAKPSTKLMGGLATQLTLADTLMTQKPSLGILEASNYHVKRRGNQQER